MTKKHKIKKFKRIDKGFTLVETLVAVSIFTISILGLLVVLSQGISNTNYAKTKIIASYLAQEGVEYIRNMRDTYVLYDLADSQTGWNTFNARLLSASCQASNGCYFDDQGLDFTDPDQPMTGITVAICGGSCPELKYDSTTGKYGYASGANSGYTRKIKITQVSADEMKVFSTVFWKQGSGNYNMIFSESLFNWIE